MALRNQQVHRLVAKGKSMVLNLNCSVSKDRPKRVSIEKLSNFHLICHKNCHCKCLKVTNLHLLARTSKSQPPVSMPPTCGVTDHGRQTLCLAFFAFFLSALLFTLGKVKTPREQSCINMLSPWSPALPNLTYAWETFPSHQDIFDTSKFIGRTSESMEREWANLMPCKSLKASEIIFD
jgi:hypothetical protein